MTEIKGVRKLYEAEKTNLPTNQTARYYGRGDGNVYVIYSTTYQTPRTKEGRFEWYFAKVENVGYEWKKGPEAKDGKPLRKSLDGDYPALDSPDMNIKTLNTSRKLQRLSPEQVAKWFFENTELPMMRTK